MGQNSSKTPFFTSKTLKTPIFHLKTPSKWLISYQFTYIAPLVFVLAITIGKEAWDDVLCLFFI
jgi:hypothetical protein